MAKRLLYSPSESDAAGLKFREASAELLIDFLVNLNKSNKDNLQSLTKYSGKFKNKRVVEFIFLITNKLRLDPLVSYHAIELLQRFMGKHIEDLLTTPTSQGATANLPRSYGDVFHTLKDKFPLVVFSCIQLASKLSLRSQASSAGPVITSIGCSSSTQALLESELMVLKGLRFRLNVPNPLTFVEILLEVLGSNEPSIPVVCLHHLCHHVLQFISLERTAIYETLLKVTTECASPSKEQRKKFVPVTEDCMLLGVGVIAVAAFIFLPRKWEEVVEELSRITGISKRSITDFAHATLLHVVSISSQSV